MIKEAMQYFLENSRKTIVKAEDGREFVQLPNGAVTNLPREDRDLRHSIEVHTLDGFVSAAKAVGGGDIAVVHEESVFLSGQEDTERKDRELLVHAVLLKGKTGGIEGCYLDVETFIINVQQMFADGSDKDRLLKIVASIDATQSVRTVDDGVSQEVVRKSGAKSGWSEVKNPFALGLCRTWPEIEQPVAPFILRIRADGSEGKGRVMAALFEVFPGAWRTAAIHDTVEYLREALKDEAIKVVG